MVRFIFMEKGVDINALARPDVWRTASKTGSTIDASHTLHTDTRVPIHTYHCISVHVRAQC